MAIQFVEKLVLLFRHHYAIKWLLSNQINSKTRRKSIKT
jgi:hypothetical protein